MKNAQWGWKRASAMFAAMVIGTGAMAAPVLAASDAEVAELKATIQQLMNTVQALEQKVEVLERQNQAPATQAAAAGQGQAQWKMPKNTTFKLYGYAKMDAIYTDTDGGGSYTYVPSAVPLDSVQDSLADNNFIMHARQTRLGISTSTDTPWGKFNTKIETDFFGSGGNQKYSNSYGLRLRRAYGELGGLRVGQDWSTFIDLAMLPETIDFGGPAGGLFNRQPMVRWTSKFEGGAFMIAAENPESTFLGKSMDEESLAYTSLSMGSSGETFPDVIARLDFNPSFGHFSIAAMLRELVIDEGTFDDSAWGGAVSLNAKFKTFGKDYLSLEFNYGNALGRYMEAEFADAFINPVTNEVETCDQWGGFAAYHHAWSETVRSNLVYSYAERDNDMSYVTDAVDKVYQSVHANLIWSPVSRINIGLEYIWGYRELENGEDGDINRVQAGFQYKF